MESMELTAQVKALSGNVKKALRFTDDAFMTHVKGS